MTNPNIVLIDYWTNSLDKYRPTWAIRTVEEDSNEIRIAVIECN